jgi:hypothetical protein
MLGEAQLAAITSDPGTVMAAVNAKAHRLIIGGSVPEIEAKAKFLDDLSVVISAVSPGEQ